MRQSAWGRPAPRPQLNEYVLITAGYARAELVLEANAPPAGHVGLTL
jgi:hypothetical protein